MKRYATLLIAVFLMTSTALAGCARGTVEPVAEKKPPKSPFSFDFKTKAKDASFFTEGETFDTWLAASPLYGGANTYPNGQLNEFEKARSKKAKEVESLAAGLAKGSRKLTNQTDVLRKAYLDFLTAAYKADPKFEPLVKESFPRISQRYTKARLLDIEYKGLADSGSDNKYADSFTAYLAVEKAVEFSAVALSDVEEIAGMAAVGLEFANRNKAPAVKQAGQKMDKRMADFDSLLPTIKKVVQQQAKLDYAIRQLETADYYMAREANDFITSNMASVKTAAEEIEPRGPIVEEDIEFIQGYVDLVDGFHKELERNLDSVDKKRLVAVEGEPRFSLIPWAWAAEPGEHHDRALAVLSQAPEAPEPGWLSKGWSAIKTTVNGAKTLVGVTLDTAGVAVRNISRAGIGVYNGEAPSSIWTDMQENTRVIRDNFNKGISGASTYRTAGEYLEGVEKGAGAAVEKGVEDTVGKGWTSWALGGISKTTVGMFTGLGKGIYKVANRDATNVELVEGTIDIGFGLIGGSKVIIKGSQVPGLIKGLSSQAGLVGQQGLNFIRSLANNRSKAEIIKEMGKMLGTSKLTQGQVTALIRNSIELEARQALAETLKQARKNMLAEMGRILRSGGKTALSESLDGIKSSLDDLFRSSFTANLTGLREALNTVGGATAKDYLDNLLGSWADDLIKGAVKEIMTSAPQPGEINGAWAGSMKITAINPKLLDPNKSNDPVPLEEVEGCDLDIDFSQLIGKTMPLEFDMEVGEDGQGTMTTVAEGQSSAGTASYSAGRLSATVPMQGGSLKLSGTFTRDDNGYVAGSGNGTMMGKGDWFAKVSWSATPK